ncbi:hypothetical protein ACIBF1_15635 [Spirillospora sp. NPDC050679]
MDSLQYGPAYRFADWPNPKVPRYAAGVYTIWEEAQFIYVGMSGRSIRADQPPPAQGKDHGLRTRLRSHAAGRRSGDQFAVYICDRFVVPTLTPEQQADIASGVLQLDALTRNYIHERLSYRFTVTKGGKAAFDLERAIKDGALPAGRPYLNPGLGRPPHKQLPATRRS